MQSTDVIQLLQSRFNPEAAKKLTAVYQITITGKDDSSWFAKIDKGTCSIVKASEANGLASDCKISVSAEDLDSIISGKLSAMTAALSGVLTIDGELGLAMQLVPIFFSGARSF